MLFLLIFIVCASCGVDYSSGSWEKLNSITLAPFARGHTGLFAENKVLTWGGLNSELKASNVRYTYNTQTEPYAWDQTEAGVPEEGLAFTSNVNVNNEIVWMYGGQRLNSNIKSLTSLTSAGVFFETAGSKDPETDPNHFDFPSFGATAILDDRNNMWLFGGFTDGGMLNIPTRVDLETQEFFTIANEKKGNRPSRRFGAIGSFVAIGTKRYLHIGGGLRQTDPETTVAEVLRDRKFFDVDGTWINANNFATPRAFGGCLAMPNNAATVCFGGVTNYSSTAPYTSIESTTNIAEYFPHSSLAAAQMTPTEITIVGTTMPDKVGYFAMMLANINGEISVVVQGGVTAASGGSTVNSMYKLVFKACQSANGCWTTNPIFTTSTTSTSTTGISNMTTISTSGTPSTTTGSLPPSSLNGRVPVQDESSPAAQLLSSFF